MDSENLHSKDIHLKDLSQESSQIEHSCLSAHHLCTMVAHFICVLFSVFVVYTAKPGSSLFSWHPALMSIAYMFFMAEAILAFSPESSFLKGADRKKKSRWHWVGMVIAASCAILGVSAIYINKERAGKAHATSYHGLLGYTVVIYTLTQCCAGTLLLYPSMAQKLTKLSQLKKLHATSGCFLFLFACLTLITGMNSTWFTSMVTGTSWYACLFCPVVLLAVVVNQVASAVLANTGYKV